MAINWYDKYIKPGDIGQAYSRGYKVGAAEFLGLPVNSFAKLTFAEWGDFFADWKKHTGQEHFPYSDTCNLNIRCPESTS